MFKSKSKRRKAGLSLAPMLDMIFILLIFFVVSTTFSKLPGVLINRPDASKSDKLPPNNLMIGITKSGDIYINKKMYTKETLIAKLRLKAAANPKITVLIIADEDSILKHSIMVMDLCKQVGIENVALAEEITQ